MPTTIAVIIILSIAGLVLIAFLLMTQRKRTDDYIQVCQENRQLYTRGVQQGYKAGRNDAIRERLADTK